MNYRDLLQKEHPERVHEEYVGGACGCPGSYGYPGGPSNLSDSGIPCTIRHPRDADCRACWDQVVPETLSRLPEPGGCCQVTLLESPTEKDWMAVKRRALVTVGLTPVSVPSSAWRSEILRARHSPIRRLMFSFLLEGIPSWVATHLARHVHAQPYIRSQRNDRQSAYDRNTAPQAAPVSMIWDVNAEELMVVANKRLCAMTAPETRAVVRQCCALAAAAVPEIGPFLRPMCEHLGGRCDEMHGCGRYPKEDSDGKG